MGVRIAPLLAAALWATPAAAQLPIDQPFRPAAGDQLATLWRTIQFDTPSRHVGRTFRIYVNAPLKPPPPDGYAVVTLLDGNGYIGTAALANMTAELTGGTPALVVGVGYPADTVGEIVRLRGRDLTGRPEPEELKRMPSPDPEAFGGHLAFRRFLLEELRPLIAAKYKVNPANQALMGHSFGGLFTLQTLLRESKAFRTWLIGSPSIRFNASEIAALEPAFVAQVERGEVAPRIFITVGALEQSAEGLPGLPPEQVKQWLPRLSMVTDASALARRLQGLKGAPGYEVRYRAFANENHVTVVAPTIMQGLQFALNPTAVVGE